MLKIRLMRIGAKKKPFYRIVVTEERSKRTGGYVELLGTYNPLTEPKEIKIDQARVDHWVKQGAKASEGFLRIIGKAPQRPPRKPKRPADDGGKKEKAASAESSGEPRKKEEETPAPTEAPSTEEQPTETTEPTEEPKK